MKLRKSVLSAAIVLGLGAAQAHAQDAANGQSADTPKDLDKVVVTGIRGSVEKSST